LVLDQSFFLGLALPSDFLSLNNSSLNEDTIFLELCLSRCPVEVCGLIAAATLAFTIICDNCFIFVLPVSLLEVKNVFRGRLAVLGLSSDIRDTLAADCILTRRDVGNSEGLLNNLEVSKFCTIFDACASVSIDSVFLAAVAKSFTAYFNLSILFLLIFPGNLEKNRG